MSSPFVAEIRIFAGNFPPKGWATCDGQLLPISQNTALFSLLGTFYGGDGKSTFALPNFQGSAPMHQGQGPGLSDRFLGESGGESAVTLLQTEMPAHTHQMRASAEPANAQIPNAQLTLARSSGGSAWNTTATGLVAMAAQALATAGSNQPHNNLQPYLTLYFNMGAPHYATTLTNPHLRPWRNAAAATIVFDLGISPTHRAVKLVLGKGREFLKTVSIDQLIVQLPARDIG